MSRFGARWTLSAALVCLTAVACSSPSKPTVFSISCPLSQILTSPDNNPVTLTYAAPTTTGGEGTVTTTCSVPSGSKVPVGSTPITCNAKDSAQKTASCGFEVQVKYVPPAPTISATKFVAFGDSITEGFAHVCDGAAASLTDYWRHLREIRPPPVDSPISYPNQLRTLLSARYTTQTIAMINEGSGGESIETGAADLARVLSQDSPGVVLLQEGTNDMDAIFFGADPQAQMSIVVTNLRSMIRLARGRGVIVFVGTLTPQRQGACRGYAPSWIAPVNDQIRSMVAGEDATLVDLYKAFGGQATTDLVGPDGLHPSAAGYQAIAQTFFDAIKLRLEK